MLFIARIGARPSKVCMKCSGDNIKASSCLIADPDGVPVAAAPAGRLEVAQEGDAPWGEHGRAQLLARARLCPQEPAGSAHVLPQALLPKSRLHCTGTLA